MSLVELYDVGWHLVVKSLPDTDEGNAARNQLLEHFDLDVVEQRKAALDRDLAVLGIGNIENLKRMARAQGKKLIIRGHEEIESVVEFDMKEVTNA